MKRDGWPICAGAWAFLMSLTLGSVAMAADPGVGVVFQQPGPGATVNGGVAVLFEGFGGADPAGNGIVSRHFVLEIDGATVADFTGTFPSRPSGSHIFLGHLDVRGWPAPLRGDRDR